MALHPRKRIVFHFGMNILFYVFFKYLTFDFKMSIYKIKNYFSNELVSIFFFFLKDKNDISTLKE